MPAFRAASNAETREGCWNHTRIIEDHHVPRPQQVRQIGYGAVRKLRLGAWMDNEQTRRIPLRQRIKRNPVLWQVEVEEIGSQLRLPGFFREGNRDPSSGGVAIGRAPGSTLCWPHPVALSSGSLAVRR